MLPTRPSFGSGWAGPGAGARRKWLELSPAVPYRVGKQVDTHPQRGFPLFGWIVMHLRILPPVAQIALIGVVDRQAAVQEDPEPLGRFAIVHVNLGNSLGQIVD